MILTTATLAHLSLPVRWPSFALPSELKAKLVLRACIHNITSRAAKLTWHTNMGIASRLPQCSRAHAQQLHTLIVTDFCPMIAYARVLWPLQLRRMILTNLCNVHTDH